MNEYNLHFISNDDLFNHVKETVLKYRFKIDLKMNSSSSQKTYMNMQNKILQEPNAHCFLMS